ncbi:ABC transporter ATP-binding protein [Caenimonas soli]|uniref:ABC transporter ATP-binding protein n=1 Tax=Caenimonas soli TaxID=2735555 RepID=UPI001557B5D5|nr:ABC transporter ATP-binding protein [Caenimonas soli]NPC59145.1 ABC transporter ATP-binding protein [Caenimonas soli]
MTVVKDLNLSVSAGERRAVIGPNGAGKTTLFNMISGWLQPSSGAISVGGKQVVTGRPDLLAREGLARSFQQNMLLNGLTVLENLRIASQALDASRRSLLRKCGSFDSVIALARAAGEQMHLGSVFDQRVQELSYGHKRQLEVAIALCGAPRILLLDEPAAGASPSERERLIGLLRGLPRSLTILLVEHDMDVVSAVCDKVTVMSYGEVLATGTIAEIRSNDRVRQAYLGGVSHA